ncbi:MAG: hypothetical protein AB4063_13335 [Crocosphaera sp.]
MTKQKQKNQLSFVRETLEIIVKNNSQSVLRSLQQRYNYSGKRNITVLHYLQNIRQDNEIKIFLDPISQITICIKILQEYISYLEVNKINEDGIIEDLRNIRNLFQETVHQGLYKQFTTHQNVRKEQDNNSYTTPLEIIKLYISILRKIESRYPKHEITEDELKEYQQTISDLLENIQKSNLQEHIKSKITKNILEIKQILDNIYSFSKDDIEKQIISNYYWWSQLDDNEEVIKENKSKFLQFATDFMSNIVSKMKDPIFISENLMRTLISSEVGEIAKKLPEFIDKINPNN